MVEFNAASKQAASFYTAKDAVFDAGLIATQKSAQADKAMLEANNAEASQEKLAKEVEENATTGAQAKTKKLTAPPRSEKVEKAKQVQESVLVRKEEADQFAGEFSKQKGNKEYHLELSGLSQLAQDLGVEITPRMSPQDITLHIYERLSATDAKTGKKKEPDASQVDKAFEFLLWVTAQKLTAAKKNTPEADRLTEISAHVKVAKGIHYQTNKDAVDSAGKIIRVASGIVDETDLTAKETLNQLREIINNPQDVQTKRRYYEQNGGYDQMIKDSKGFYHHIGNSLKKINITEGEGRAEMGVLHGEIKTLQATTQVVLIAGKQSRVIEKRLRQSGVVREELSPYTMPDRDIPDVPLRVKPEKQMAENQSPVKERTTAADVPPTLDTGFASFKGRSTTDMTVPHVPLEANPEE